MGTCTVKINQRALHSIGVTLKFSKFKFAKSVKNVVKTVFQEAKILCIARKIHLRDVNFYCSDLYKGELLVTEVTRDNDMFYMLDTFFQGIYPKVFALHPEILPADILPTELNSLYYF